MTNYFRYWGKAHKENEEGVPYHPLSYHCLDVAACAMELLKLQPTWLNGIAHLSGLKPEQLRVWLVFLLAIHDIGKFADGFQQQRSDLQKELQGRETNVGGGERHDTLGYVLGAEYLLDWLEQDSKNKDPDVRGLLQPWLAAVTGHHGRPPRNDGAAALILRNHFPVPVVADVKQFVTDIAGLLLPAGIPLPPPDYGLEERYQQTSWLLAGLAVTADWLGSNTLWFRYQEPVYKLAEYWRDIALPQARKAVEESGLVPATASSFTGVRTLFPKIRKATPLQAWAETTCIAPEPQIFVLEELTGGGKTEAALTLAARLMEARQGQGVYLALPTMATADAMFDRVRKDDGWRRFFAEGPAQLVLAHSADKLKLELENRQDRGYGKNEELSASRHCTVWLSDSRKKALLADFGVGTVDQALLAVLPVRHQSLRLLGLAGKILIVDEVHACDCYMGELLARLLSFHAALGGSVILLSATLPIAQRARYLQAFAQGAGFATKEPKNTAYPLTTHLSATCWDEQQHEARKESARTVAVDALLDEAAVFQRLKTTVERGGCAVWVRNSVVDAVQTWQDWKKWRPEHPAILFHARFALVDRLRIGKTILETFGPDSAAEDRRGRLVIATQVIEQSLDADFDDMVTDLAPIDLVIQRAGRLQRHRRDVGGNHVKEPDAQDGRGGARLAVLMPQPVEDTNKNWISDLLPKTGKVYPDHGKLWLTAYWLTKHGGFELPSQARDMIESVYVESAIDSVPDGLKEISDKADGACRAGKSVARGNLLNFGEGYSPTSQIWQDDAKTPTRLNEVATVRVRLARLVNSALVPWADTATGMDWALSELNVPDYLVAKENPCHATLVESARKTMLDEGRYVVIIVLEPSSDYWRGHALNKHDEAVRVLYSPELGLTIETGEEDESDL